MPPEVLVVHPGHREATGNGDAPVGPGILFTSFRHKGVSFRHQNQQSPVLQQWMMIFFVRHDSRHMATQMSGNLTCQVVRQNDRSNCARLWVERSQLFPQFRHRR